MIFMALLSIILLLNKIYYNRNIEISFNV